MHERTSTHRETLKLGFVAAFVGMGIAACSSSQSVDTGDGGSVKCGTGTTLVNGECVIADAGTLDADSGDSADAPADAPCPPLTGSVDVVDCATDCGRTRPDTCNWTNDQNKSFITISATDSHDVFYIRTPHDFASVPASAKSCPMYSTNAAYSLTVFFTNFTAADYSRLRIRVEPPFYVAPTSLGTTNPNCYVDPASTHCFAVASAQNEMVNIFTLPGTTVSGSQNIVIDMVPVGQPVCP